MTGEEMAEAIVRVEERSHRNEGRIKNLENTQELLNKTATSVEVMTAKLATIEQNVTLLMQKVDKLENLPGKRWEAVLGKSTAGCGRRCHHGSPGQGGFFIRIDR